MLKADFHIHTKEDKNDKFVIRYNSKELIDHAAKKGFDVLALTYHGQFSYNEELANYAREKGILLIPGIESYIKGRHVIILNTTKEAEKINTFEELREFKRSNPEIFIIAPHPYYPRSNCLQKEFLSNIDVFDGVEYCHYYCRGYNPYNKKAIKVAKKHNKTVVGTSDAHWLFQFNKTYSLVDAEKSIKGVMDALRQGKVEVKTKPLSYLKCSFIALLLIINGIRKIIKRNLQ